MKGLPEAYEAQNTFVSQSFRLSNFARLLPILRANVDVWWCDQSPAIPDGSYIAHIRL